MSNDQDRSDRDRTDQARADGDHIDWTVPLPPDEKHAEIQERLRLARAALDASSNLDDSAPLDSTVDSSIVSVPTNPPSGGPRSVHDHWGSLELVEKLGEGAFGEVYRAHDPMLDRHVALKLLRKDAQLDVNRFVDEGRRLAKIRHPNVLVVYGADVHDGVAGLWMDLVEGQTLEAFLVGRGSMSAHEATLIGTDLCRAVAAVHAQGLVHRDIKTVNVMREQGGRIVLMDFGSATPTTHGVRPGGVIEGTPFYMAPELLLGSPPTPRSDLFALGVLLYRLVTGRYPIEADSLPELLERRRNGESRPLREVRSDLSAQFIQIVERATDPDPKKRYAGCAEMERALLNLLSPSEGAELLDDHARSSRRGRTLGLVAAALLMVIAGTWGVMKFTGSSPLLVSAVLHPDGRPREALGWNSPVAVGEKLVLTLDLGKDAYVYVINQDDMGNLSPLFPLPQLEQQNPLPGGQTIELPGRVLVSEPLAPPVYADRCYEVHGPGRFEDYLVIISAQPVERIERDLERIHKLSDQAPEDDLLFHSAVRDEVRGIFEGGLRGTRLAPRTNPDSPPSLLELVDTWQGEEFEANGVRVLPFRLEKRQRGEG